MEFQQYWGHFREHCFNDASACAFKCFVLLAINEGQKSPFGLGLYSEVCPLMGNGKRAEYCCESTVSEERTH